MTVKGQTRDHITLRAQYLENYVSWFAALYRECLDRDVRNRDGTNNFPEIGRGLGHVTPTIFGSTVGYPSDSLASCCMIRPCDRRDGRQHTDDSIYAL